MNLDLTDEQAKDLFSALISAHPAFIDNSELEIHEYSSDFAGQKRQQLLIRCGYVNQRDMVRYELTIGYFDEATGQPLETIDLTRWDYQKSFVESLSVGRVGYVTDKLRAYGIWGQPGRRTGSGSMSFTGWQIN